MADYYTIIAKAVDGLDPNTGAARRRLYDRARVALVAEMRSARNGLDESDILAAQRSLEAAIGKIEADAEADERIDQTGRRPPICPAAASWRCPIRPQIKMASSAAIRSGNCGPRFSAAPATAHPERAARRARRFAIQPFPGRDPLRTSPRHLADRPPGPCLPRGGRRRRLELRAAARSEAELVAADQTHATGCNRIGCGRQSRR